MNIEDIIISKREKEEIKALFPDVEENTSSYKNIVDTIKSSRLEKVLKWLEYEKTSQSGYFFREPVFLKDLIIDTGIANYASVKFSVCWGIVNNTKEKKEYIFHLILSLDGTDSSSAVYPILNKILTINDIKIDSKDFSNPFDAENRWYIEKLAKSRPVADASTKKARKLFGGLMD